MMRLTGTTRPVDRYQARVEEELERRGLRIVSYSVAEACRIIEQMFVARHSVAVTCDELQSADLTYSPHYYPDGL